MSSNEEAKAVFGYGSLIFPGSIAARLLDVDEEIDRIYNEERRLEDEISVDESLEYWNQLDRVELIPAKISGYRRVFSYQSPRGGSMLSAYESGNEDDFINGVVITGLTNTEVNQTSGPEEDYGRKVVDSTEPEYYTEKEPERQNVLFYTEGDRNFERENIPINLTYQDRVMMGIKMLGEEYGDELVEEFFEDYLESTYFISESKDEKSLTEKTELVEKYRNYLEED